MTSDLGTRIEAMYRSDRLYAVLFVVVLWLVLGFVLYAMWGLLEEPGARGVLLGAAALVLVFNTASITAMIRHNHEDKAFIYGLDLKHQDALAARRDVAATSLRAAAHRT
jgi:hypothetical protein